MDLKHEKKENFCNFLCVKCQRNSSLYEKPKKNMILLCPHCNTKWKIDKVDTHNKETYLIHALEVESI